MGCVPVGVRARRVHRARAWVRVRSPRRGPCCGGTQGSTPVQGSGPGGSETQPLPQDPASGPRSLGPRADACGPGFASDSTRTHAGPWLSGLGILSLPTVGSDAGTAWLPGLPVVRFRRIFLLAPQMRRIYLRARAEWKLAWPSRGPGFKPSDPAINQPDQLILGKEAACFVVPHACTLPMNKKEEKDAEHTRIHRDMVTMNESSLREGAAPGGLTCFRVPVDCKGISNIKCQAGEKTGSV